MFNQPKSIEEIQLARENCTAKLDMWVLVTENYLSCFTFMKLKLANHLGSQLNRMLVQHGLKKSFHTLYQRTHYTPHTFKILIYKKALAALGNGWKSSLYIADSILHLRNSSLVFTFDINKKKNIEWYYFLSRTRENNISSKSMKESKHKVTWSMQEVI